MARTVLFVCTGNIFRSMSAEYCLHDHLLRQGITGVTVSSAGTRALPEPINPSVREALAERGIDCAGHRQRKLSKEILDAADLVIAMSQDHADFIREQFGKDAPLFDRVALGRNTSVWDLPDRGKDGPADDTERTYIHKVIRHIHESVPKLAEKIV